MSHAWPLPFALPPAQNPTTLRPWLQLGALDGLLLLLAFLAQRQHTRPFRLAIAPFAYALVYQLSGGLAFDPVRNWFNYVIGLGGCYVILLIPRLSVLSTPYTHPDPQPPSSTIDLLSNPSLAGWNPTPYYTPSRTVKPPFRSALTHLAVSARDFTILIAATFLARDYDDFLDVKGSSIWALEGKDVRWLPGFVPYVHPLHKWVGAVGVTAIFGLCVYLFVEIIYHLWAAISIGLGWRREEFGEVFDRPWLSSSMHEFWGKRWHPLFSPTFAFYSHPFPTPLKPVLVFLLSGLIHDFGAIPFRPSLHPKITLFFLSQTLALLLERGISRAGLGKVGGRKGRVWVWAWVIATGMVVVEEWIRLGLLGMAVRTLWRFFGVDKGSLA